MQNTASARSEYIPTDDEQPLRPLRPENNTEAARKTPYELREQVCLCNDANLTDFAKLLFCRLTDMAFKEAFKRGDGVVECSKKFLADDFACSVDTVTRATRLLERSGFLWTKISWNGSFEITRWCIRDWADDKREYSNHGGGNFGRRLRGVQRNTERNGQGRFTKNPASKRQQILRLISGPGAGNGAENGHGATVKAGISPDHGQESALTGLNGQPCQGAIAHRDHGQESALTRCNGQPWQGAAVSPDTVQLSALTRCNGQPWQGSEMPGLSTLKNGTGDKEEDSFKRSTGFNAERAPGKPRKASAENVFLLDVREMLERWKKGSSKAELSGSGAWWRLAYRQNAELMRRVLADTLAAVKEGRVKTTPGQMAADTWRRFGGTSVAAA